MQSFNLHYASKLCKLFLFLSSLMLLPALASADTFVCTGGDVGCVIASMAKANANGPGHDYLFLRAGTYLLTRQDNRHLSGEGETERAGGWNGLPRNTGALTIIGAGQGVTWLGRDPQAPPFRLFDNAPTGGLTISGLTLAQGDLGDRDVFGYGGCLYNEGSMMLVASTVRECAGSIGGGLYNQAKGELLVRGSVIVGNGAWLGCGGVAAYGATRIESRSWIGENVAPVGGGICAGITLPLVIEDSVIDGNISTRYGGGGISGQGPTVLTRVLVSENVAAEDGGGIEHRGGHLLVTNSTFWGNMAAGNGGGLAIALYSPSSTAEAHLRDVAVLFNVAGTAGTGAGSGGGVYVGSNGVLHLERVWLLFNQATTGAECAGPGTVTAAGWVVSGDPTRFREGNPCD